VYVRSIYLTFQPERLGRGVDVLNRSYAQAIQMYGRPLGALMTDVAESNEVAFITHWETLAEAESSAVLSFVLDQLACAEVLEQAPRSEIDVLE
jgi:hypothetical protein